MVRPLRHKALLFLLVGTAGSCSITPNDAARLSLRPGQATTKYHLRQDGAGAVGSDFFPWDIDSLKSNTYGGAEFAYDLTGALPFESSVHVAYSKIDAEQSTVLDPSRTWIWNGDAVTTFDSSASFERMEVGMTGRTPLTDSIRLRYGLNLRRFLFDGDIFTDANAESFNFDSLWLSPEVGLTFDLPWSFQADLVYSGFMRGEAALGDQVLKPYGAVGELRRDFGRFDLAAGYELDHVEMERPLGGAVEFAHLRVRTIYLVFDLQF